ncbi:MAG: Uma2 family endonuclease [Planctomycetota bacterium]|nr:Uma2 family endonuclease [Planctomycetota bacterium]MDA0918888.1 Uma2 family endonuclease [Planctomycetota bacterium]MDA1158616.1 Uma2 family endonuclease [Planctomycetota bacterium]
MSTATPTEPKQLVTAESLLENHLQQRCELIQGEIRRMSPAGSEHGWVVMNVAGPMMVYVKEKKLGYTFGAETGFIIERSPDTVRAPDVAFVAADRVTERLPTQFFPGPPDLAVEVLSPSDSASEVQEKAEAWLNSGCREVWLIDPRRKSATRLTPAKDSIIQQSVETLTTDLLPGFSLAVAELFR